MCVSYADPEFVSSAFIKESADSNPTGDDDKIYFFFTEVAKEYDLYTKVKVPRVARVCKVTPSLQSVIDRPTDRSPLCESSRAHLFLPLSLSPTWGG